MYAYDAAYVCADWFSKQTDVSLPTLPIRVLRKARGRFCMFLPGLRLLAFALLLEGLVVIRAVP